MNHLFRWLANLVYVAAGLIFLPIAVYRMVKQKRYLRGWKNRFGAAPCRFGEQPAIWLHAVSLGETNAAKTLIDRLRQQLPFHEIYVSVNTDTGYDRACTLFGKDNVFFSPFDFSFCISRAFKRLKPSIIILMELEVWPNLLSLAKEKSIPTVIVNGRVTERGFSRYKLLGPLTKRLFRKTSLVLAQDEVYSSRFAKLGVTDDKLFITGSLKWDTADSGSETSSPLSLASAMGIDPEKGLFVAGSTGDDMEEEIIIRCYQQLRTKFNELQMAIIPRKPERFDRVAKLISARGFSVVRRSEHPDGSAPAGKFIAGKPVVYLGDTMGELKKFYALASLVFVGRTLVPMGGSDMMEVAALGKPILVGPHTENFSDAVAKLISANAIIQIDQPEKLASAAEQILSDPEKIRTLSQSARNVVLSSQGATTKTASYICSTLGMEYDSTHRGVASPKIQ